ncbi:MAG TPA: hypothetical protein PLW55_05375, partial [Leptospiraceae bacterium]|nr:hypothetical protein [Leptospiraceae bacterium]
MRSWLALAFFCLSHAVYAECDREWVPGNSLDLSGSWKYAQAGEASSPELDDSGWKRTSVPGLWGKNP